MNPDELSGFEDDETTPGQKEWEANQLKHTLDELKYEQDMADLDALEESEKSWNKDIRTTVEKWWRERAPLQAKQFDADIDKYADFKFEVAVEPHLCSIVGKKPYDRFTCYHKWDTPVDAQCDHCGYSYIVIPETIKQVIGKPIPRCIGCSTGLYQIKEGEIALCGKCDKIWCNVNRHFQPYGEESLMDHTSPMPGNILRRLSRFNGSYTDPVSYDIVKETKNANLISSEVVGTLDHKPVLDIDLPCKLISSTHAGHHHLYIDKAMSWDQYKQLLNALAECGIIQKGYLAASKARGFSSVRLPWIKKEPKKVDNDDTPG